MLTSGVALLLAKDRAAELQREADRKHHRQPMTRRSLGLLLRQARSRRQPGR